MRNLIDILKTKMARNALWLIGAKVYHVAVNLIVSLLMARYLGPSNYGLINYAASFTALCTTFCTLGIGGIIVNELLHHREEQGVLLGSSIGMRLISSTLSVMAIIGIAWVMNPQEPLTIQVVAIYSLTLVFQSFDTINRWYQANLESRTEAMVAAIGYTAACIYKVWLLVTQKDVRWFAASHAVEGALVALLLLRCYCRDREQGQRLRFSWNRGTQILSKSYHFILSGMMVAVYGQMDRIMLKAMLDETAVGYYSAAVAICSMWPFLLSALIEAAKPVILSQFSVSRERFNQSITVLYGAILYISFAAAVFLSAFAEPIILVLYGEAYVQAKTALQIVSWYTAFSYLGVARGIWIVATGMQKYEKYIAGIGAMSNLILNGLLIPVFGVGGAAFATLLTQLVTNFLAGFLFSDIRENNCLILRSFMFWKYLSKPGEGQTGKDRL